MLKFLAVQKNALVGTLGSLSCSKWLSTSVYTDGQIIGAKIYTSLPRSSVMTSPKRFSGFKPYILHMLIMFIMHSTFRCNCSGRVLFQKNKTFLVSRFSIMWKTCLFLIFDCFDNLDMMRHFYSFFVIIASPTVCGMYSFGEFIFSKVKEKLPVLLLSIPTYT